MPGKRRRPVTLGGQQLEPRSVAKMTPLSSRTSRFSSQHMWSQFMCLGLVALALLPRADALYFYLKAGEQKCFFEELPNHTIVVGA